MRERPGISLNLKKVTKKMMVLGFIAAAGRKGRSFSEIQRFVVELNGKNYDELEDRRVWDPVNRCVKIAGKVRRYRGYWCTNLSYAGRGILDNHCIKSGGRWFIRPENVKEDFE